MQAIVENTTVHNLAHTMDCSKLDSKKLVNRYKKNYSISRDAIITESMVRAHWHLERRLRAKLLKSKKENRLSVFEYCYSELYSKLPWLNKYVGQEDKAKSNEQLALWAQTIGAPPCKVYEVGSGRGELIVHLAKLGFACKGTEITHERAPDHHDRSHANLEWGVTDGIHLDSHEKPGSYDVVISNQVIEHLHPDDVDAHFKSCHHILKKNGRYIFNTPHRFTGPHDISRVFKSAVPRGMHLKEYTYSELVKRCNEAGFTRCYYSVPKKFKAVISKIGMNKQKQLITIGKFYLKLLLFIEEILDIVVHQRTRFILCKILKAFFLFTDNIFLTTKK